MFIGKMRSVLKELDGPHLVSGILFFETYHPIRVLSSVTDGTPADQTKSMQVHFSENNVYCSVFEFLELADTFAVPSLDATLIV